MSKRDNFKAKVRNLLALSAAYQCSSPTCGKVTVCANEAGDGTINIGRAAHITAAAEGGPRFDKSLSPDQRAHQDNGIWLCANCASLIDSDAPQFSVTILKKWKKNAEKNARDSVAQSNARIQVLDEPLELDLEEEQQIAGLELPATDTIHSVVSRLNAAAQQDLNAFRARARWPRHAVDLSLHTKSEDRNIALTIQGLANLLGVVRTVSLISAPGRGKSTTLTQLAAALNEGARRVAVLAPLAEWSAQSQPLFTWFTQRGAFHNFSAKHFKFLAIYGRLTLLLDGWNELDLNARSRLLHEIEALERDCPLISLLVTTRQQSHDSPLPGPVVWLGSLTVAQQVEIARALRGESGAALLDQAQRTAGVRELISIPLYLTALLANDSGERMPATKEEVLRLFVEKHETDPLKVQILERELLGFHRIFLQALAVAATAAATTVLTAAQARTVISQAQSQLVADGQMAAPLQPGLVVDALVNYASLVRVSGDSISFQHQQFQEWFASVEVEKLAEIASSDPKMELDLKQRILNLPAWEESIFFACERMSLSGRVEQVASLIRFALAVDPLLAAELIYRTTDRVWDLVKNQILVFIESWHQPGVFDRAVRFMTVSGRSEFADKLWELLAMEDAQLFLASFRSARRFRPNVLGNDVATRLSTLSDERRSDILSELASEGGIEGLELAAEIAKADPSLKVKHSVLATLVFRDAERQVADLLSIDSPALWRTYADLIEPEEVPDPEIARRLRAEKQLLISSETDPARKVFLLLEQKKSSPSTGEDIALVLRDSVFSFHDDRLRRAISLSFESFPAETTDALIARLRSGKAIHHLFDDILSSCMAIEDEALAAKLLDGTLKEDLANATAKILGPATVGNLIDRFAEGAWVEQLENAPPIFRSEKHRHLGDLLAKTRLDSLVRAIQARAETKNPLEVSAYIELIARHDSPLNPEAFEGYPKTVAALIPLIAKWSDNLAQDPRVSRERLSYVPRAVIRVPAPELFPGLLRVKEEDTRRRQLAIDKSRERRSGQALSSEAITSYTPCYNRAFIAIGDNNVVQAMKSRLALSREGVDAARILRSIWAKASKDEGAYRHMAWPDFSNVARLRQVARNSVPAESFSPLLCDWLKSQNLNRISELEQEHALDIGALALSMPSREECEVIADLLALPLLTHRKHFFYQELVLSGREVSADQLLKAVEEIAEAAKTKPWLLTATQGHLERWFEFFPFSDRPEDLFTAMSKFKLSEFETWRYQGTFAAICFAPIENKEAMIRKLAQQDPRLYAEDDWLDAVLACSSGISRSKLLEDLVDGRLLGALKAGHGWRLVRDFVSAIREEPSLRSDIYRRLEGPLMPEPKSILLQVISEAPDLDGIFHLIRANVEAGRGFDGNLRQAIEEMVLTKEFISPSKSAFQYRSVDATVLRSRLFALTAEDTSEGAIARRCLQSVDFIRDENGQVDTEPRHPDLASGRAWPMLVSTKQ